MAMVASNAPLSYEEARKQRVEENNKKMQALGLFDLSKNLVPVKKTLTKRPQNGRKMSLQGEFASEARRSSRVAAKPPVVYRDQLDLMPGMRVRSYSRDRQPLPRRYLSDTSRMAAIDAAEEVYKGITNPAFVKPMLHSHTASGFWLGLPANFCKEYLPHEDERITLEDVQGEEAECVYLANKVGLSGGWRGWSLDHELVDGDCCIFELVDRCRFKVYVFRCEEDDDESDFSKDVKAETEMKKAAEESSEKKAPASAPADFGKGRKLSTSSTWKLDLEDGEENQENKRKDSPKTSRKEKRNNEKDVRGSKRKRGSGGDDVVRGSEDGKKDVDQKTDLGKEAEDVIEIDSGEDVEDFRNPSSRTSVSQAGIRSFGRVTRNSAAKFPAKKSE